MIHKLLFLILLIFPLHTYNAFEIINNHTSTSNSRALTKLSKGGPTTKLVSTKTLLEDGQFPFQYLYGYLIGDGGEAGSSSSSDVGRTQSTNVAASPLPSSLLQGRSEAKINDDKVHGNFFVNSPDGQTKSQVTYTADTYGFHPVVRTRHKTNTTEVNSHFALGDNAVEEFHRQRKRNSFNDSIFDTDFVVDEDGGKRSTFKKILNNMFSTGKISDLFLLSYDKNAENNNADFNHQSDQNSVSISTSQPPLSPLKGIEKHNSLAQLKPNSPAALLSRYGYLVSGTDLMKINNAAEQLLDNENKVSPQPEVHHYHHLQGPLLPTIRPTEAEKPFRPSFEGPIIVHDFSGDLELENEEDNVISPSHYQPMHNPHPQLATGQTTSTASVTLGNVQIMNDNREKVNEKHQLFIPSNELDNFQEMMEKHLSMHNNDITMTSTTTAPSRLYLKQMDENKLKGNYELFVKLITPPPKLKDNTIVEIQKSINLRNKLITEHNGELLEEHEEINEKQQQPTFFYPKATIKQQPTTKLIMLHQPLPIHKSNFYSNKAPISLPVFKPEPLVKPDMIMSKYEEYAFEHPSTESVAAVAVASATETSIIEEEKPTPPFQVTRFVTKPLSSLMNIFQQDVNNNNKLQIQQRQPPSYMLSINGNLVPVQLQSIPYSPSQLPAMETVVEKIIKRPIQGEKIIERPYPVHIPFAVHVPYPIPMPMAYPMSTGAAASINNISSNLWPPQNHHHQQQRNVPTFELSPPPEPPLGPIMYANTFDYKTLPEATDNNQQQIQPTLQPPVIYNEIALDGNTNEFDINAGGGNNIELPANYIIDNRPQLQSTTKMKNIQSIQNIRPVYHFPRIPNKQQNIRHTPLPVLPRFQKQTLFPYELENIQNMKPPPNLKLVQNPKFSYLKNTKNKDFEMLSLNNKHQHDFHNDNIGFAAFTSNTNAPLKPEKPPIIHQLPSHGHQVHNRPLSLNSNINQNLNLYARDYPQNHHKKRSPDFGRNLRVEYGFKPPLIPSLEIDDKGLPLPPKKSDNGA
ncbi:hypothetical protein ACFFRR_009391 [Megaselia abdita]